MIVSKAVSIAGKEVFDFHMINHVDATEGDAYTDMSRVDTSVTLTVGCIQVVFLNKFISTILVSNLGWHWFVLGILSRCPSCDWIVLGRVIRGLDWDWLVLDIMYYCLGCDWSVFVMGP